MKNRNKSTAKSMTAGRILVVLLVFAMLATYGPFESVLTPAEASAASRITSDEELKGTDAQDDPVEGSDEASGDEKPASNDAAADDAKAAETESGDGNEGTNADGQNEPIKPRAKNAPILRAGALVATWADLAAAIAAATDGDTITLTGDLTANSTITIDKSITLAGNYTIYRDGSTQMGPMFSVTGGALTLDEGLTLSGKTAASQSKTYKRSDIASGTRGFFVEVGQNGKLVLNNVTIRDYFTDGSRNGNRDNQPEGVSPIFVAGEFEMNNGASIVHNWASAVDRGANYPGRGWLAQKNAPGAQFNIIRYNSALVNEDGFDGNGLGANINGWDAIVKDGEDAVLEKTTAGAIFIDAPGKTSTINGGTISDNAGHAGAIAVASGTLVIKDGVIGGDDVPSGTVSDFNRSESQGNWGDHFGTIYVVSKDAEVRMCGGSISHNATVQGGGVFVTNNGTFFLMNGSIDNNNTMGNGGGLLIYSDKVYLLKGRIENNIAPVFGGGIYVYGDDHLPKYQYTTTIHNAEITGNKALENADAFRSADMVGEKNDDAFLPGSGGGIWLCPAGTVEFDASTINLYDNVALRGSSNDGQGKDFHKDAGFEGGVLIDFGPHEDLAQSSNDQGNFTWYHDELNNDKNGKPLTEEEATSGEAGRLSIYNKTKKKYIEEPQEPALFITGNVSRRGGGIGANGSLLFIEPTDKDKNIDKGRLGYEKTFDDSMEEKPMEYEMVLADDKGEPVLDEQGDEVIISIFRLFDKEWADAYDGKRTVSGNDIFGQLVAYWPEAMEKNAQGVWKPKAGTTDADYSKVEMLFPSGQHGINYFDTDNPDMTIIMREYDVVNNVRDKQVSSQIFHSTDPEFAGEPEYDLKKDVVMYPGPGECNPDDQTCDGCDPGTPTSFQLAYRTFPFTASGLNKEEPEIEKYINEAVHSDIRINDEFTYNILAYVTTDADEMVVTDKLDTQLKFASNDVSKVKVYDLGMTKDSGGFDIPVESNHLPVYDVSGNPIDNGKKTPSVKTGEAITIKYNDYSKVTIDEETQKLTVKLANELEEDGIDQTTGETIYKNAEGNQELTPYRGHWVRIEFKAKLSDAVIADLESGAKDVSELDMEEIKAADAEDDREEPNVGNDPVKSDEDHKGIINNASYEIKVKNEAEAKYKDKSNTVTVKPEEPEIEKYVNQAVHDFIKVDEVFTYDILAYVTHDADKLVIKDDLVDDLEFAPGEDVKVYELDESNHKVTNNINGDKVNNDASVAEADKDITDADGVTVTQTNAGKLTVTLDDGVTVDQTTGTTTRQYETVKGLRGKWVKVTFKAQIKKTLQNRINAGEKPEEVLTYAKIKAAEQYKPEDSVYDGDEKRPAPNKGNAPVKSDEDHDGVENTANYEIFVGNKAEYKDESNTVTIKPEQPEIEKYVNQAVHKPIAPDEVFTYDILAYVTHDADKLVIKDKLVDDLEFAPDEDVKVYSLNKSNHKVTNDVNGAKVNADASVAEAGTEITGDALSISTENGELVVTLDDDVSIDEQAGTKTRQHETVQGLRGKWVKVTFKAQIKSDLQEKIKNGEKPEDVLTYVEIKANKNYQTEDSIYKDGERPMPNEGNAPVDSDEDHEGIENTASYEISVGNTAEYKDESNTVTVKPEEPEIEKYINRNVHKIIGLDEVFTYDIIAYVTKDADEVEITDTLVDDLEFVSKAGSIKVVDLGETVDHKPNGSVAEKGESVKSTAEIKGQTLTITIADAAPHRGHWVKATFQARLARSKAADIKSGKITINDLKNVEIKNGVVLDEDSDRLPDNDGNLPVITDEEHSGVPNTSSYRIKVGNEYKYEDKSNTVTVKPTVEEGDSNVSPDDGNSDLRPEDEEQDQKPVQSGDDTHVVLWIFAILASAAALEYMRRRRMN